MKILATIYLSVALLFGIFLVSQPILLTYINGTNHSSIYSENNSIPAEESTEKNEKEITSIHYASFFDIAGPAKIIKEKIFIRDEQCGHLFTPSILVPPPEILS
jgi:hypothetical protein